MQTIIHSQADTVMESSIIDGGASLMTFIVTVAIINT